MEVLQAISKRVHYGEKIVSQITCNTILIASLGKFVSESKFMENPAAFIPHILNPDRQALDALITKPEIERKLLQRLQKKAATYAQEIGIEADNGGANNKIDVDGVVDLYESYIIPLTKEVEVRR